MWNTKILLFSGRELAHIRGGVSVSPARLLHLSLLRYLLSRSKAGFSIRRTILTKVATFSQAFLLLSDAYDVSGCYVADLRLKPSSLSNPQSGVGVRVMGIVED